ncbi:MAG: hypothetical protein LC722_04955 [Actinobacteria bacterium]|nr:hypothetical protein [Actinomycetota bacterium]
MKMNLNAPKLVTMALALVLTVAGLHLTGTVTMSFVTEALQQIGLEGLSRQDGYLALLASPVLLILGSFLPNL